MSLPEFKAFASIPRLFREAVITEKLDGTNAIVHVADDGTVTAGSRNRWLTPEADNFGFAAWVAEHAPDLWFLGPGYHYGEWWGCGIQRGYGLKEKRFSLFNVGRWGEGGKDAASKPACCHVVPVIWRGTFGTDEVRAALDRLQSEGSFAAPGWRDPEGVVVWHEAGRALYKATLHGDGHKGARR